MLKERIKKKNCHAFNYTQPAVTFARVVLYVAESASDVAK
jgi:hypothetical protein